MGGTMTARVIVSDEVLTAILNYLAGRPWREVKHLIDGISDTVEPVEAEAKEEMVVDFPPAFTDS
jgi:hypothetical protein